MALDEERPRESVTENTAVLLPYTFGVMPVYENVVPVFEYVVPAKLTLWLATVEDSIPDDPVTDAVTLDTLE